MCNSGVLVLPPFTHVCGVNVENFNVVRGAVSITSCTSGGGGFFDAANPTSSHCSGLGVSGSLDGTHQGCMDASSPNYSPLAAVDDGSCSNLTAGCTYAFAANFDPLATVNDGSCNISAGLVFGCTYDTARNYDPTADMDDGSCDFAPLPPPSPPSPPSPDTPPEAPPSPPSLPLGVQWPGQNLGFESSPFKLTPEFVEVLLPILCKYCTMGRSHLR